MNLNGTLRIEEGVYNEQWMSDSGSEIVQILFEPDSLMVKVWQEVKELGSQETVEVMMCSGDSTKTLAPGVHGGMTVGRKAQTVVWHFDDIHNFTFLVYGRKTFLVAPSEAVTYGSKDENVNHDTYVYFSSSSIGMYYTDSRNDSPQSFLFFPDTAAGADKPRGCFECGDVVQRPQGRRLNCLCVTTILPRCVP